MASEPVAIIGFACALPGVDDLDALHSTLSEGRVHVGAPSADRVANAGGTPGADYAGLGYLGRVDLFDHEFFGISLGEAEWMDPHQRMNLQLAHRVLENAGYAPDSMRGSNTAVILSAPSPGYADPLAANDPQWILGSLPSATAGRIAYLLDLVGPAMVVDTACSSSLVAVALAVDKLRAGVVDTAIAGGVSIRSVLPPRLPEAALREIQSPDEVCRPFDANANGTVGGEGGGLVLLKLLSRALADGDNVHAVIRGISVNQNGFRATGMSAPSQQAHADAILAAWADADVPAESLSHVECHGSGTSLGDMIEIDGLQRAFGSAGGVTIGSVKANIGHLDHAAGIAGLAKLLAGLRHRTHYPTPHFTTPNSMLDPAGPLRVSVEKREWEGPLLRAGLSSFGLTGTNVHAVIEQAPSRSSTPSDESPHLVTVSAKSAAALERYAHSLADFLSTTSHGLAEVAHALNRGRDDHRFRWACTARDIGDLTEALRNIGSVQPVPVSRPVVLVFSGDDTIDGEHWSALRATFPQVASVQKEATPGGELFARQFALYELARSLGITEERLAGSGAGNLVVRAVREQMSPQEALAAAHDLPMSREVNESGLRQLVDGLVRDGAVVVELGRSGLLSSQISALAPDLPVLTLFGGTDALASAGRLYELGARIDWERYYSGRAIRRIEVPTYPFEPVSCWRTDSMSEVDITADSTVEAGIAEIWQRVLKANDVMPDTRYFDIGGTSIAGIAVLKQIGDRFGVRLGLADLIEHSSVRELAKLVTAGREDTGEWAITVLDRDERLPLSLNQEQLWFLDQLHPSGHLYNIPTSVRLVGHVDMDALRGALSDLRDRHEVLRSRILDDDGEPYVATDAPDFGLTVDDLRHLAPEARQSEAVRLQELEARTPFDLARGPLLRAGLIRLADSEYVLLCTRHHIIFDGWSHELLLRDVFEFYSARIEGRPARLPEMPVQYADFAAWQRTWLTGDRLRDGLAFWRSELAGVTTKELPLDHPRPPVQSHKGHSVMIPRDTLQEKQLGDFCRQEGVTAFVTVLASITAVMHVWGGQQDVLIGSPTSGRLNPATHEIIGYFNNMLPFRTHVDSDMTFRELVHSCAGTVARVLENEHVPFGRIVAEVNPARDLSRHALFNIGLIFLNEPIHSPELPGLTAPDQQLTLSGLPPGTAKFDLCFTAGEVDGGLALAYVNYAADLFDPATAQRVVECWQEIAVDPDRPLRELR